MAQQEGEEAEGTGQEEAINASDDSDDGDAANVVTSPQENPAEPHGGESRDRTPYVDYKYDQLNSRPKLQQSSRQKMQSWQTQATQDRQRREQEARQA